MKKTTSKLLVAALATSAIVAPVSASADSNVEPGVYFEATGEFYTTAQLSKLPFTKVSELFSKNKPEQVFIYMTGVGTASLKQANASGFISAANSNGHKDAPEKIIPKGTYKGTDGSVVIGDATPTPTELKVESVSAINANEVLVTFNKELNKTSAETVTNYTINGQDLISNEDLVTLQSDKKSVIIKFNGHASQTGEGVLDSDAPTGSQVAVTADGLFNNNTAYTLGIKATLTGADEKTLGTAVSKGIFFADSVKPTVSEVKVLEGGNLQVKFSERYAVPGTARVFVDGILVNTGGETLTDDTYNGYYTIPVANITAAFTGAGKTFEAGKTYPVIISGFTDLNGANTMNVYTGSVTNSVNNEAPTVVSLVAKDEKTLELTFSEEILNATKDGVTNSAAAIGLTATGITKNGAPLAAASTATTTDGKKFTINLPTGANQIYDGTKNETTANLVVKLVGFKDLGSNVGATVEKAVTVTKDTVKPSISKIEYSNNGYTANGDIRLTLSENATTAAAAALQGTNAGDNFYITDANGVRYNVATAAIVDGLAGGTDKTIDIDLDTVIGGTPANGTYTLHVAAGAFSDQSVNTPNTNAAQSIQFTVTGQATETVKPTAAVTTGAVNGQITVTYSEAVTASATALANYKLNGVALPANTIITLNAARTVATITLPDGYVETTAARTLTISGVQDLAGNVIDTDTQAVTVNDNKKPLLTAAKVVNGELVLTFSENVDHATSGPATAFVAADFEVKVNGVDVTEQLVARNTATDAKNQLKLTASDANFSTGTVTVKVLNAATATDAAGNLVVKDTFLTATR